VIESQLFRDIMADFPSGVTVVTALDRGGSPHGMTVSAFCSVSLEPPLVLVCIEKSASSREAIQERGGYSVNFLAAGQAELSVRFATREIDRFEGIAWSPPQTSAGGPLLDGVCVAQIECATTAAIEAGDHWIFVAAVERGWLNPAGEPILHWSRRYFRLGDGATRS
jgi:flavin reductase (DIM6/NTAB) family NADH-FMN oxidoreductase RutF